MQSVLRIFSMILLGGLLLPSCGLLKNNKKITLPTNPNIRLSGRVQSVNKDSKFVLIRRYGPWKVGEGQVVESRGDGRTANLIPSGEKLGEHVAADIRSGEVEVGDAVYIRRVSVSGEGNTLPATPLSKPEQSISKPPTDSPSVGSSVSEASQQSPQPKLPTQPVIPAEPEDQL